MTDTSMANISEETRAHVLAFFLWYGQVSVRLEAHSAGIINFDNCGYPIVESYLAGVKPDEAARQIVKMARDILCGLA